MQTNLKGNIFGGLTAGIVALPLALAFGVQSGMGAIAGIYGAIALGFFAAILGGTNTQISGPTGPITVVSALIVATMLEKFGTLDKAMPVILITFFLAGFFQFILSFMRVGKMIRYMPYPVVSGFMTGIGLIIILMQVFPFLGHSSPNKIFDIFLVIHEPLSDINPYTVILTLSTIALVYLLPLIIKVVPSQLLALLILTIVAATFHFPAPTIGNIPEGLPQLQWHIFSQFSWSIIPMVLIPGLTLAALGAIDSLLTSVVADNMTRTKHHSDKELFGQGVGNMIAACIGGLPGAGATMRTVVNIKSGGTGKLSGVIHSLLLLIILLGAGVYAAYIPLSVLAGILITVGISIIDYRGLKVINLIPRADAVILIMVILLTIFVNLLHAVAAGMVLAAFSFMKQNSELIETNSKVAPLEDFEKELSHHVTYQLSQKTKEKIYVEYLQGPLFFGFVSHFKDLLEKIPDVQYIIIRMKEVPYIDQSGIHALEDAILYLSEMNIKVLLTGLQPQPEQMLRRIQIVPALVAEKNVFPQFADAISWIIKKDSEVSNGKNT